MAHDVTQTDNAHQSSWLRVIGAGYDYQTVNATNLDQREDGAKRIVRMASNHAGEVMGSLFEGLSNGKVEGLVCTKANEGLFVSGSSFAANLRNSQ